MKRFFIGELGKRFGLNPRTIRYYERIGILPKAGRTESGYRIYSDETIKRLEFILKAKSPLCPTDFKASGIGTPL